MRDLGGGWGVGASPAAGLRFARLPARVRCRPRPALTAVLAGKRTQSAPARGPWLEDAATLKQTEPGPRCSGLSSHLPQAFRPRVAARLPQRRGSGVGGASGLVPRGRRRATADPGTVLTRRGDVACPRPGESPEHPLKLQMGAAFRPREQPHALLSQETPSTEVRVRLGPGGRRPSQAQPGGSELEARARSSALYRAHGPPKCGPLALLSSPGLREGQRTYKKIQQKKYQLDPQKNTV